MMKPVAKKPKSLLEEHVRFLEKNKVRVLLYTTENGRLQMEQVLNVNVKLQS